MKRLYEPVGREIELMVEVRDSGDRVRGDTKERLLDVAEQLVAERGFDAVSLRQITSGAGTNLAAVNYHFGTRVALFQALVQRRVAPINRERLAGLDRLEAGVSEGEGLPLEGVLEAFFRPVVTIYRDSQRKREVFFRFMGRCMAERDERMTDFMAAEFRGVVGRFSSALARAVPGMELGEVQLRLLFSVGVMAQTLVSIGQLPKYTGRDEPPLPLEELTARMVEFCAAGFRAGGNAGGGS